MNYRRFLFIDSICPSIEARKETFKRGCFFPLFRVFESALNMKIVQEMKTYTKIACLNTAQRT
jgi:hypothetical protein